jgi:hypothetical protein
MMPWVLIIVGVILIGFVVYVLMNANKTDSGLAQERVDTLSNKYSSNMTRYRADKEAGASEARTELAQQISIEMGAVLAMNDGQTRAETSEFDRQHNLDRLNWNLKLEEGNHQTLLEQNELTRQLIGEASKQQMDVSTYLELKRKVEMDRLDLDKQWREAEQQLKAGFIFQLQAHQHLALMTEYIGTLYSKSEELLKKGKERERKLIEEHIEFMEGDFRGRQRLLQTTEQENAGGSDENTDATGNDRPAVQAEQE